MSRQMTCPKGHSWDAANGPPGARCPLCGSLGADSSAYEQTMASEPDPQQTLDAPMPAARPRTTPAPTTASQAYDPQQTIDSPMPTARPRPSSAPAAARAVDPLQTIESTLPPALPARRSERSLNPERSLAGQSSRSVGAPAPGAPATSAPFTIIRQHARGGLGCVNLARDEAIQRDVALKQILPHLADNPHSRTRFVTEAKITGQLEHPGIVPVYNMGTDASGHPYYVMKFVRGRTLDDHIADYYAFPNPLVFRELLRRFVAVCQAIAYAHSRSVIHRDIKPSNIMLGDYGETLVLDWGLAKDLKDKSNRNADAHAAASGNSNPLMSQGANLTMDGQIIGTPAYMSPEQASGKTELHGPASDIFSLGGVLYKLLSGQAPNIGKSSSSSGPRTYTPPAPPSTLQKEVDPQLEAICLKAMSPRPEDRYQRAMELGDSVLRWLDDTPLRTQKPSIVSRFFGKS